MIIHGDMRQALVTLDAQSIEACVTDPPYELGFMGKAWDRSGIAFAPETWAAVLRVLKPGAHLVAFGGTRTFHRMTCAIEDAGFEIRDCLSWLYGSGFPKSLDVSKAIDREAGAEREILGMSKRKSGIADGNSGPQSRDNDHAWAVGKSVAAHVPITAPATDIARLWEGWGTALKPAWEPIILARKPLTGTVAGNVHAFGTGAINVDGCRIPIPEGVLTMTRPARNPETDPKAPQTNRRDEPFEYRNEIGRWPANVVLDEEAAAMLDAEAGESESRANPNPNPNHLNTVYGAGMGGVISARNTHSDRGGPSRFFYTAKASRSEREEGLAHLPEVRRSDGRDKDIENPRLRTNARKNHHATVKPLDLMRWLCRLVTPPGGAILDPFLGSGTTGCAAILEGFDFIGIEREAEYVKIAQGRMDMARAEGHQPCLP